MDIDSTVPPGSMTPMFSPIPWATGENDALGEPMMDVDDGPGDEGLMSPLMLNEGTGVFASQQARSPTPEPEDEAEMSKSPERGGAGGEGEARGSATGEPSSSGGVSPWRAKPDGADPGSKPYLGRVDELDSGPITSNGHHDDEERAAGVGEAGNMTPHGMSDGPVPLSSTTVIGESQREIAPLPRRGAGSAEGEDEPKDAVAEAVAEIKEEAGVKDDKGEEAKEGEEAKPDSESKPSEEVKHGEGKAEPEAKGEKGDDVETKSA